MITIDPTDDYKNHYVHNSLSKRLDGDAIRPWPDCGFVHGTRKRGKGVEYVLLAFALSGCATTNSGTSPGLSDNGGNIALFAAAIAAAPPERIGPERVLWSAATLHLAKVACLSPQAALGFHQASWTIGPAGMRAEAATAVLLARYPACVRRLLVRDRALASGEFSWYLGAEILAACPGMPSCG